jgi:hypothetical protein
LYDLTMDPREMKNLAPDKPDMVKRLTENALAWRKAVS